MDLSDKSKSELILEIERLQQRLALAPVADQTDPSGSAQSVNRDQLLNELYQRTLDLIPICDERGYLLFVNQAWCDQLGYASDEVVAKHWLDFVHPQYAKVAQAYWKNVDEPDGRRFRTVLATRSGKPVYVSGSISIRIDERGDKTYRGIFHDISDQVRAERARNLYNSIASLAIHSASLQDLFHNIFRQLKGVIRAEDFGIAIPGSVAPGAAAPGAAGVDFAYWTGPQRYLLDDPAYRAGLEDLVNYAIFIGRPLFLDRDELAELIASRVIRPLSVVPQIWIGIPLVSKQQVVGLLFVQHQRDDETLSAQDLELLDFVSGQVAAAIDRKADEEKLNEQQSRQYAIFESSSHLVWSVDRHLKLTAFNQNFEKTLGAHYGTKPQLGHAYHADYPIITQTYLNFWESKYQEAFRGRTTQFEVPLTQRGTEVWKLVFINPIYREDGSIREVSGIAHDITQRKKSETALLDSEAKFRTIYESFQDIYFRCRLDGTITMVSPSVSELTHYETYDVLGKNITNYYLYDKRTKNLIRRLVKRRTVRNFEATIIKEDGKLLQCICNVRLVESLHGKAREIEGVARDITELKKVNIALQKAKDEAERSLLIKEAFLANMSHEIRTPMNGILNMINLLADTPLADKQREFVSTVQDSSETLLAILNDILDLSKIEAGKMRLQREAVSVADLFDKVHRLFAHQAMSKEVAFHCTVDPQVPEALLIDEVRLRQVVSNLVSNALKFTNAGGTITLRVGLQAEAPQARGHLLRVSVVDTGIGIAPADQAVLFKNFSQVDTSVSKRYAGTGLGLSIARQLVELMGGEIGAVSAVAKGSTFWFTFRAEATTAPTATVSDEEKLSFGERGPRVLVVDDNAINRRVAQEILQRAGCTVTMADGGQAAIAQVPRQPLDIILMDIQMPNMSGIEATQRLRSLNLPQLPPVVAMTAYSMDGDKDKFIAEGLDDYISKPIRPDEMLSKVATLTGYALQRSTAADAPPEEEGNTAIISEKVLQKLAKYGGRELIVESLQDFEAEAEALLDEVEAGYQTDDYARMLKALHTLKGNASTLGVDRVAQRAKIAESKLREKKYEGLSEDLLILGASFLEFKRRLQQHYKPQHHV